MGEALEAERHVLRADFEALIMDHAEVMTQVGVKLEQLATVKTERDTLRKLCADMAGALAKYDAWPSACPLRGHYAASSAEDCPKCGADRRSPCGPRVTAAGELIEVVRVALSAAREQGIGT